MENRPLAGYHTARGASKNIAIESCRSIVEIGFYSLVKCHAMLTLRAFLLSSIALLCAAFPARATGSLSYEGGGYFIDMAIGLTEVPVVASVKFYRPDDQDGILLPSTQVVIEEFDVKRQTLVLRFVGSSRHDAIEPFTLTVIRQRAVLQIGAKRIASKFSWSM
jgi:hypothetical protein